MFISPVSNFNVLTAQCMSAGDLKLCVKGKNDMPLKTNMDGALLLKYVRFVCTVVPTMASGYRICFICISYLLNFLSGILQNQLLVFHRVMGSTYNGCPRTN